MTRPRQIIFEVGASGIRLLVYFEILQCYSWQKHICGIPVPSGSWLTKFTRSLLEDHPDFTLIG